MISNQTEFSNINCKHQQSRITRTMWGKKKNLTKQKKEKEKGITDLSNATHSLWIRRYNANCPHIMQNIFCSNCFSPYPWFSKSYIFWNVLIKVMADHLYVCRPNWESDIHNAYCINTSIIFSYQHVKMLVYSVGSKRSCGVCRWRQDIFHTTYFDDIWSMTTASTFTVHKVPKK
jgi:hypothetical protein